MLYRVLVLILALYPAATFAGEAGERVDAVIEEHILSGFSALSAETEALKLAATTNCNPSDAALRAAYNATFDAWMSVSHLRFGPTETDDRAFALAFWPDAKGFTPKSLGNLIADNDPAVRDPSEFAHVSIAARGLFALEFMLYDSDFAARGEASYRCDLIRAIAQDIDANADAILADWQGNYASPMRSAGTEEEAVQELYKSLITGLQFTSDTRLGRPLGTFDRPRPTRAEARRSERSLRNVEVSLETLRRLATLLAEDHPATVEALDARFADALEQAAKIDDPAFAGVSEPQSRFRIEILQQHVDAIREFTAQELGPLLGVATGFNALDGD